MLDISLPEAFLLSIIVLVAYLVVCWKPKEADQATDRKDRSLRRQSMSAHERAAGRTGDGSKGSIPASPTGANLACAPLALSVRPRAERYRYHLISRRGMACWRVDDYNAVLSETDAATKQIFSETLTRRPIYLN